MLKFVIIFSFNLLQYLLSLLQYTHCLLIPVFTYEFTVFDITILTEILQYQLVKNVIKKYLGAKIQSMKDQRDDK